MRKPILAFSFSMVFIAFSQGLLAQDYDVNDSEQDTIERPEMPDESDSAVVETPNLGSAAEDRRQDADRRQDGERRPEGLGRPDRVGRPDTDNSAGGIGAGGRLERGNTDPGAGDSSSERGNSGRGAGRGR